MTIDPKPWDLPWSWMDAAAIKATRFTPSRSALRTYERQLRSVAGHIRSIVGTSPDPSTMQRLLREYSELLTPWANQSAVNMMIAVNRKNEQVWRSVAGKMGDQIRQQLKVAVDGASWQDLIRRNVNAIKNMPIETADKIADIVSDAMVSGIRVDEVAAKIQAAGDIGESRARMIAHTEVSKAGTVLTEMRAVSVGSEGYIWRTADDDARPSHAEMEGEFVNWTEPPTLDGMTGHAGEFPWCRCYPEPVIPGLLH